MIVFRTRSSAIRDSKSTKRLLKPSLDYKLGLRSRFVLCGKEKGSGKKEGKKKKQGERERKGKERKGETPPEINWWLRSCYLQITT